MVSSTLAKIKLPIFYTSFITFFLNMYFGLISWEDLSCFEIFKFKTPLLSDTLMPPNTINITITPPHVIEKVIVDDSVIKDAVESKKLKSKWLNFTIVLGITIASVIVLGAVSIFKK